MNDSFLRRHGAWLAVALVAVAVYANSLANGFALDDTFVIQVNKRVHDLGAQSRIWLTPYWPSFGTELGLYRPFAIFMYAVEWALGGGEPLVFHAANLLFHATTSVLAYFLLATLAGAGLPALLGALLFAVHPVRTEAVANMVGQAELIAGACTLAACLLYARRPHGAATRWPRRLAITALFAVAVLTKESAIVLPALLVALDVAQRRVVLTRESVRSYLSHATMLLFLLAATGFAYIVLRVDVLGSLGGVDAAPSLPFLREHHRVPTALRAWPEYVRLLFLPTDLAADYSPAVILPVEGISPMALLGAGLLALTALLALLTPAFPSAGLPAAWFLISILPVSNLLLPIGVVVAERLLYTPAFAVSLIVAFGWPQLERRIASDQRSRRVALAAAGFVLLLLAGRTYVRNPDWKDTLAVWDALVRDHPESYRSPWIQSSRVYAAGNTELGIELLEMAHRLWPNDSQLLADLGYQYIGQAQYARALPLLERSRELVPWVGRTELLLAQAAIGARDYERALAAVTRADRLGADHSFSLPLFAQAYEGLGRMPEAIGAWRAALVHDAGGQYWTYWSRLARALATAGDRAGARRASDAALERTPQSDTASVRLVRALRAAIDDGCYAPPAPADSDLPADAGCMDPLAAWDVLVPQHVLFATNSQNASGTASNRPDAGAGQPF